MIKTVIFDFDGVIVDSEKHKFVQLKKILAHYNLELDDLDFKIMVGKKTDEFLRCKFPKLDEDLIKQVVLERRACQKQLADEKLISGIKELIGFLRSSNYRLAITTGSNRDYVLKILNSNDLNFFDLIVSGENFVKSKPSSECYEVTLSKLDLKPSEVLVIEDSAAGVSAATAIGCKTLGIETYLNGNELWGADKVFKTHYDILSFFRSEDLDVFC